MQAATDFDPKFAHALASLAGSNTELEFERRGAGASTYYLHGQVVGVDSALGKIQIRRTRTHAGEIHEMGLRYFLRATVLGSEPFLNSPVMEQNQRYQARQQARRDSVTKAIMGRRCCPDEKVLRSVFVAQAQGTLDGYPLNRYVFRDREDPSRQVRIIARSLAAALRFMAMQDIFMPLNDMLWYAVDAQVLWPAAIAFDKQDAPQSWSVDWLAVYEVLAGIPKNVLSQYLQSIHSGHLELRPGPHLSQQEIQLLLSRGLLYFEAPPSSIDETLDRIEVTGLRELLRMSGSSRKSRKRSDLVAQVHLHMTPALDEAARQLMRPVAVRVKAPCGLAVPAFDVAVGELRNSLFLMRQWLRRTRELYREDQLQQLVDVA